MKIIIISNPINIFIVLSCFSGTCLNHGYLACMYIFDSYTKCSRATFKTTILFLFCHWNPKWWGTPLRSVLAAHYLLILSSILKGHFYNHSLFKTVDNVCWQPDSRMNSWTWLFDIDQWGTLLVTSSEMGNL